MEEEGPLEVSGGIEGRSDVDDGAEIVCKVEPIVAHGNQGVVYHSASQSVEFAELGLQTKKLLCLKYGHNSPPQHQT